VTSLRIEALSPEHVREGFTCGVPALDEWFVKRAGQDQRRNVAKVFVGVRAKKVVGFYSLSMFTLSLDAIPPQLAKKLPRYEAIPAAIIGRLARAESERGSGLGGVLLADALRRVVDAASLIAAYAIVVDAKDDAGKRFYESYGFIPLASRPKRLFLPMETAAAAVAQVDDE
jgi:GNAT superfamily N-acetyltransferase